MTTDIVLAPKTSGLSTEVFHADISADIRLQSGASRPHEDVPSSQKLVSEHGSSTAQYVADKKREADMQIWWDEAIAKNMDLPDGYEKVAVLLIKWADELDELKTRAEAEELNDVFRHQYRFHTEIVELNVASKPQHQISRHITTFIQMHDGPNNLMIVYYTGHGEYKDDQKYLELAGYLDSTSKKGFNIDARANWNKAEEVLCSDDIEGDVLTILDTCYSSNLVKSGKEDTRTFELLSACAFDVTTSAPGDFSFTRALIDALKDFLREDPNRSFTTSLLSQRINQNEIRRDQPCQLWFRMKHHDRHIRLAPLDPERERERKHSRLRQLPKGYLSLRLALDEDSLNQQQIEYLTKKLAKAITGKTFVGIKRIDWLGLKPARVTHFGRAAIAMISFSQWKKIVNRRREERGEPKLGERHEAHSPTSVVSRPADSTTSSPRKRLREEYNDFLPGAKQLRVPRLPSPPISLEADGRD
ncbi:hypothetical protein CC78DRAFT_270147 [Lojkania enalia]|uniref:Peptidase C14 caspase domain-containing protein n=1 Tax=Lojkania enalia TaxID=147567 RepID=A0A9P4KCD6_9PLEO|nr:hypothetical protein CC78DRAFT_270147 [Didymosphaeria enalia]